MQIASYICGLKSSTIAVSVSYPVHTIDQYSPVFFLRYVWACEYFYCNCGCGCDCSCEFFECVHCISVHSTFKFLVILTRFSFFFFFSVFFSFFLSSFYISYFSSFLFSSIQDGIKDNGGQTNLREVIIHCNGSHFTLLTPPPRSTRLPTSEFSVSPAKCTENWFFLSDPFDCSV
jgi:hypothetical protein